MELKDFRIQLDEIDAQLVALFCRRMEISRQIGAYKRGKGLPVRDEAREALLLDRVAALAGEADADAARALYGTILEQSRAVQKE